MENHPIPQDVTGFQFKLIGNMTVKQFAYLAAGIILSWITFSLPMNFFIKLILIPFFAGIGGAVAFIPVEGRSMDIMLSNFFKAVFNPTQYIFAQQGGKIGFDTRDIAQLERTHVKNEDSKKDLSAFLNSVSVKKNSLDDKEMVFLKQLANFSAPQAVIPVTPSYVAPHAFDKQAINADQVEDEKVEPVNNHPVNEDEEVRLEEKSEELQKELTEAKKKEEMTQGTQEFTEAHQKVIDLERILTETVSQKEMLEKELIQLKKRLETEKKDVYSPSVATPKEETKNVRSIPKGLEKKIGIPNAPEYPNIICGIIKDPRENPLPNILVEVKDGDGNPVRAFKTNQIGQFASATPLSNGTYTIEFDDPQGKNKFDTIQFSASGDIISPIEIISVDQREELRRSLFN